MRNEIRAAAIMARCLIALGIVIILYWVIFISPTVRLLNINVNVGLFFTIIIGLIIMLDSGARKSIYRWLAAEDEK